MRIPRVAIVAALLACPLAIAVPEVARPAGAGKPIAGCPHGGDWHLVTVVSLGLLPGEASGIPSLDGNGDGWTCIALHELGNGFTGLTFRDNNVRF